MGSLDVLLSIPNQPSVPTSIPSAVPLPRRPASSTPLPLPSNGFASLGYSFILLDERSKVIQEISLAVAPEEFRQVEMSTSNVVLTAGDVFTDSFGPGVTMVSMSGTFGQRPTGNSIFNFGGNSPTSSGQFLVLQLRDMFRKYLDLLNPIITDDATKNVKTTLQFYNPKDNEFWNIEPVGNWFQLSRSKSAPFLYRYELSFACVSRADSSWKFLVDPQTFRANITNSLGAIYTKGAAIASTYSAYASGVLSTANQAYLSSTLLETNLLSPFASLQTAVNSFLANTTKVINFPFSEIKDMKSFIGDQQSVISSARSAGTLSTYDPMVDYLFTETVSVLDSYSLYPNSFVKAYTKSDFVDQTVVVDDSIRSVDPSKVDFATYVQIKDGDTLESISMEYLGDSKYWKDLAEFNGLAYPFISSSVPRKDKTLGVGQYIAVPNALVDSTSGNLILGSSSARTSDASLGTDFALTDDGDLSFDTGEIQTTSGEDNLKQAVYLKLNVHRGELVKHPHYGMADLLGYRTLPLLSAKASSEFGSTLLSDTRISEVKNMSTTIEGDTLTYSADVGVNLSKQPVLLEGSLTLT